MPESAKTVLIVDDNSYVRSALRSFMERNTVIQTCCEAADGLEAVEEAKQRKPGLILMDLSMPKMNGVEAACIIRRVLPNARIIMFTLHPAVKSLIGVDVVVSKDQGSIGLMEALRSLFADSFFRNIKHQRLV
jgi:DNA-binding NarL/FixJ family response regulator